MARKVNNDKGFLIIEMSVHEAVFDCGFGFTTSKGVPFIIDDNTNETIIEENVFYIAALNMVFTKDTYENWYKTAVRYTRDIPFEQKRFNYYLNQLDLNI